MGYNIQQERAIKEVNGPMLIIAGPGTGKTFTLVERIIYMVSELNIDPSNILISTFTNKASFELLDRLSIKFRDNNINKDVNDMMIGNFHSIAREIIDDNIDLINLKKGYTQIDEIEQKYLINRYLFKFREIEGYSKVISRKYEVSDIVKVINKISEEGILDRSSDDNIDNILFSIIKVYEDILESLNMIDYSHILLYTYKILKENDEVRKKLQSKINYIMIDEYQDTNVVQEKIIDLLLNENQNICVVGDDDQSLYRFRGASVKNILNFNKKYDDVKVIKLMQNYRSDDSIIKFYQNYINTFVSENPILEDYRYKKLLFSDKVSENKKVFKLIENNETDWMESIYNTIVSLKKRNLINEYNEVCLLFDSINKNHVSKLFTYIKRKGIDIYIPKRSTLFSQKEVQILFGAIYTIFRKKIIENNYNYDRETIDKLEQWYNLFKKSINNDEEMIIFISKMSNYINSDKFSLNLYDICYRLFQYTPFYGYMNDEDSAKIISRSLELFKTFNLINQLYEINEKNIDKFINLFFFDFIKFIKSERIKEFEEDTKIPDKNSISAMTIHASKGMEYPVVIVGITESSPYSNFVNNIDRDIENLIKKYSYSSNYEPDEHINQLDFYRKFYTAFSRAKNLLVLSKFYTNSNKTNEYFDSYLEDLEDLNINEIKIEKDDYVEKKVKSSYSYTVDILPFIKNPLEYYYKRELNFTLPQTNSLFYGSLVHESIEYINKILIKNNKLDESIDNIVTEIGRNKYINGAIDFNKDIIANAIKEVKSYYSDIDKFGQILYSELNISYSKDDYIINGNVDMIFKRDNKYHIVDFKTGTPPNDNMEHPSLEDYKNQLNLYAYLLKLTKDINIDTINLYFTSLDTNKHLYEFKYDEESVREIEEIIDETVKSIESKEFYDIDKIHNTNSLFRYFFEKSKELKDK